LVSLSRLFCLAVLFSVAGNDTSFNQLDNWRNTMLMNKFCYRWLLFSLCLPLALPVAAQSQTCPGTGDGNTCYGVGALNSNTSGDYNTAIGDSALYYNTNGNLNTSAGFYALELNTTGYNNTANGGGALYYNTTGSSNTATGSYALELNKTGNNNTAVGYSSGSNVSGSNNVDIANPGLAGESGVIRIGDSKNQTSTYIAGVVNNSIHIRGNNGARPVVILPSGQLGVAGPTTSTASGEVQKQQREIASLQAENQALKAALKQQGIQLASLKQAQQQQLQMLSKLATFVQTKAKAHPQKAIYQP
jgi:hypothetical protein